MPKIQISDMNELYKSWIFQIYTKNGDWCEILFAPLFCGAITVVHKVIKISCVVLVDPQLYQKEFRLTYLHTLWYVIQFDLNLPLILTVHIALLFKVD